MLNVLHNKIVLITSGQPALNPRLVKEADALAGSGYQVTVIYQYWTYWGTEIDKELLPKKKWKAVCVGGSPKENKALYWTTRIQYKAAKILVKYVGFKFKLAERTIGRCTFLLLKEALLHPADLYIAHNLAALPVAVLAAQKNKVKCGFDAEDFHRNETSDDPTHPDVLLKSFLEEKYISKTDYLTASSWPITRLYQKLFPGKKITTVLNAFPVVKEVSLPIVKKDKLLKLFWFSQTIGLDRGLQDILSALKFSEDKLVELHLLGFINNEISRRIDTIIAGLAFQKKPVIVFHQPINPDQLPIFTSQFDVGLALEPNYPLNRDICLTNKIFTYLQAGLAIIASDTVAQKQFINENPGLGFCYEKGNTQQLAAILKRYVEEPDLLRNTKKKSYQAARLSLNWETESIKFLKVVAETLAG